MVSPFGILSTRSFLNNVTSGIVSNRLFPEAGGVKLPHPALYLFDGKTFPGSEGGGVFNSEGRLAGLVLPALKNKETPVELSFVAPARLVLDALKAHLPATTASHLRPSRLAASLAPQQLLPLDAVRRIQAASVNINVSQSWGSGVIVSPHGCKPTTTLFLIPSLFS